MVEGLLRPRHLAMGLRRVGRAETVRAAMGHIPIAKSSSHFIMILWYVASKNIDGANLISMPLEALEVVDT